MGQSFFPQLGCAPAPPLHPPPYYKLVKNRSFFKKIPHNTQHLSPEILLLQIWDRIQKSVPFTSFPTRELV